MIGGTPPEGDDWYVHAKRLCPIDDCMWNIVIEKRLRGDSFSWWVMDPLTQEQEAEEHLREHEIAELVNLALKSPSIERALSKKGLI